jgi:hypothetical protein
MTSLILQEPSVMNEYADDLDLPLLRLSRVAVRALERENSSLAAAYAQGSYSFPNYYRDANQGLAYWVAETHLVYEIYKAWIPLVRIRWEAPVYPDSNERADLAVYEQDDGKEPVWVFEAKWWGRNSAKVLDALSSDLDKLSRCNPKTQRRFLMTFWWAENTDLARERSRRDIDAFCVSNLKAKLKFLGGFPTDSSRGRVTRVEEFTMGLLELC